MLAWSLGLNNTALRNQIRHLRFAPEEMPQEALAEAAGVTGQSIIALESHRYVPFLELALRITRTFGVNIEAAFQ